MKAKYVPPTVVSGRAASRSRVRPERRGRVMRMARPSSVSSSLSSMYLANEQFYATKWPLKSHQKLHTWYLGNTFNRFFFFIDKRSLHFFVPVPKLLRALVRKISCEPDGHVSSDFSVDCHHVGPPGVSQRHHSRATRQY